MERKTKIGLIIIASVAVLIGGGLGTAYYLFSESNTTPASKEILTPEDATVKAFARGINNLEDNNVLDFYFEPNELNALTNYFIKTNINPNFSTVPYSFQTNDFTVNNFYLETIGKDLIATAVLENNLLKTTATAIANFEITKTGFEIKISDNWKIGRGNFNFDLPQKFDFSYQFENNSIKKLFYSANYVTNYTKSIRRGAYFDISNLNEIEDKNDFYKTRNTFSLYNSMIESYDNNTHHMEMKYEEINSFLYLSAYPKLKFEGYQNLLNEKIKVESKKLFWTADLTSSDCGTFDFGIKIGNLETYCETKVELEILNYGLLFTFGETTLNQKDIGSFPDEIIKNKVGDGYLLTFSEISSSLNNDYEFHGGRIFGGSVVLDVTKK